MTVGFSFWAVLATLSLLYLYMLHLYVHRPKSLLERRSGCKMIAAMPTFLLLVAICFERCYTVSQKNDTDVAHYNFNTYQPNLVIFGRDIAE